MTSGVSGPVFIAIIMDPDYPARAFFRQKPEAIKSILFHFLLIFDFYKNNADKFSLTTLNLSGFVEPVALYTCSIISPMLISGSAIPLKRIRII